MDKIEDFLRQWSSKNSLSLTTEGHQHFYNILGIIYNKMFNPDKPESMFVTLCFEEKWEQAGYVADTRNREANTYNMFKDFSEYVKKSPEYIQYNRQRKII